ncbi:cysteine synthase A [Fundicoccus ignavus]|uniref:cysteine synthase n=1 Tax=Fundicoccus ignavus TaxID=2664442 RepID=A0A844C997_9LACT|nr:cysteine synthase A [Fundicoccus ignavus]MRJ45981.1 cysteine synthase A [Fundicoccus ignavus]
MLFDNIVEAIGYTPIVKIQNLPEDFADVYVKLEKNNPSGSVKDRPVKYIVQDLLASGKLAIGGTLVESTSGNTGVGLAMIGAALGIKVIIVMPDSMSLERRTIIQAYGAELVLTPASGGMILAGERAEEIAKERSAVVFGQFTNEANVKAHAETTAHEILEDIPDVAAFVAGIGTGGTVSGVGQTLKANNKEVIIWAVEPAASPLITQGLAGPHKIQGLGANFVPEILDQAVIDHVETVTNEVAIETAVKLAKEQGILAGISSGANYAAAVRLAEQLGKGKKVVVVLPDSGERYLSTGFYGDGQVE